MKQIQQVLVWINGQQKIASLLNAYIINDNLTNSATFYWSIWSEDAELKPLEKLSDGNLTINGPEYDIWGSSADINQAAYEWIADQLSLILIS